MKLPIVIYLDSSDWSNLAAAVGPEPFAARDQWLFVRLKLLAARNKSIAEFRFSSVIATEIYGTSKTHHTRGVARAETIADLCGPRCLLEHQTLMREEAKRLALNASPPVGRTIALRDDGAWYANPDELAGRFGRAFRGNKRDSIRELLKEYLPNVGRKNRRPIEEAIIDRRGRLLGLAGARSRDPVVHLELQAAIAREFGLSAETPGLDVVGRVYAGEADASEVDAWMIGLLRNLPVFFSSVPTQAAADRLFAHLRAAGRNIIGPIREAADAMQQFVSDVGLDAARRLYADRPWLDTRRFRTTLRENLLSSLWNEERKRRSSRPRVRGEAWFSHVHGSPFGSIPSLDSYLAAASGLLSKTSTITPQPYRGRVSDAGDVLHMTYLPYVDVFRCDSGNAQIAKRVVSELSLDTRVSETIEDLLTVIDNLSKA